MNEYKDKKISLFIAVFLFVGLVSFFCFAMLFTAAGYNTFSFSDLLNFLSYYIFHSNPLSNRINNIIIVKRLLIKDAILLYITV